MNLAPFYDTETTGLPLFSEPSEDPRQPHIVQLGACLIDLDTRKTHASIDVIIKPEGWTIPPDIEAIHGISTEMALDLGVSEAVAVEMLLDLVGDRVRIAHNETFDARIVRIATKRYFGQDVIDAWKAGRAECTARLSTPICALPPTDKMKAAKRFHHKTPTLVEAYRHFTGSELQNAHSAMADAQGCMAVYFAIQDLALKRAA